MTDQRHPSSSPPPRRARYAAVTALIGAAATLLTAVATRVVLAPEPIEQPAAAATGKEPIPVPPKEEPTTDDGVVASRIVRDHANEALIENRDRTLVLEMRACILERELRYLRAEVEWMRAGKRGAEVRRAFEQQSKAWDACPAEIKAMQERGSLRDAADSARLQ